MNINHIFCSCFGLCCDYLQGRLKSCQMFFSRCLRLNSNCIFVGILLYLLVIMVISLHGWGSRTCLQIRQENITINRKTGGKCEHLSASMAAVSFKLKSALALSKFLHPSEELGRHTNLARVRNISSQDPSNAHDNPTVIAISTKDDTAMTENLFHPRPQLQGTTNDTLSRIPLIIHQTWSSSEVPTVFATWVRSWVRHHPRWQYWFWTDSDGRNLVRKYYGEYLKYYDGYPKNIHRADLIRYFILHKYGGVYADLDVEVLRPLDDVVANYSCILSSEPRAHARFIWRRNEVACNALMASKPGHPFFSTVIKAIPHFFKKRAEKSVIETTGPIMLAQMLSFYTRSPDAQLDSVFLAPSGYFLPTFDPLRLSEFKELYCKAWRKRLRPEQTEVCEELEADNFANRPENWSYTNHHWLHTYSASNRKFRRKVNIDRLVTSVIRAGYIVGFG